MVYALEVCALVVVCALTPLGMLVIGVGYLSWDYFCSLRKRFAALSMTTRRMEQAERECVELRSTAKSLRSEYERAKSAQEPTSRKAIELDQQNSRLLSQLKAEQKRRQVAEDALTEKEETECERIERQTETLRFLMLANRAFLDSGYRINYARTFKEKIRNELKDQWAAQYCTIREDKPLFAYLERNAREVVEWLEARMDVILRAESLFVEPPSPPPPPPKSKKAAPPPPPPPPPHPPTPEEERAEKLREEEFHNESEEAFADLELKRRQKILDERDRLSREAKARTDLTETEKQDRINQITVWAELRLEGGHDGEHTRVI